MKTEYIWGLFVVDERTQFPNYYPIGIFSTREKALNQLRKLAKEYDYELVRVY
ncbi:hypothetical protein GCM10025859_42160 [Alicyclobacillus fastidiosus]|nr:hypothetical protein GCM10025859_42160 [Alicyclobacillus fastidiosus]